jgi:N-acetylmuramic acid 6-phosphate etherase
VFTPRRAAIKATDRYIAPVSMYVNPSRFASLRAIVLLPAPAGPSIAITFPDTTSQSTARSYNELISSESIADLVTEQPNPASARIDLLETRQMLEVMNAEDRVVATSITPELSAIARAVDAIVAALRQGGRLFYIGAGTSGRLGVLDASECPPTFNVPTDMVQGIIAGGPAALSRATEASEDDAKSGASDLSAHGFTAGDILCGITASGRTPYVLGAIDLANQLGAVTIGLCCTPNSELSHRAQIAIAPVPGPEIIAGSTRLKAGTATKLVLNMLTTGAFIRLGYVRGNLMVNVQPKNEKLLDRALRIISSATGVSTAEAQSLLAAAGNNVRTAIANWESTKSNG